MKEKETTLAISAESAQSGDSKEAETKAEVSTLPTGEKHNLAAGGTRNKEVEFDALIKGEYKQQFSDVVQKIISKRIKEVKELKETAEKNARFIEALMQKMGIEDNDLQKLERKVDEDLNKNNSEKDIRTAEILGRLVEENAYLKREGTRRMQDMKIRDIVNKWKSQESEIKKTYSDFELKNELENPEFCRLIRMGVDMKTAYEVVNIESILEKNSKDAEKMVVDAIRFKGKRPVENGSEATSGLILSSNVSKLTKKQRAELAQRAAKGERISF